MSARLKVLHCVILGLSKRMLFLHDYERAQPKVRLDGLCEKM